MLRFSILGLLLFSLSLLSAQREADYIDALALHLGAQKEVAVTSGRVDLETATHAIEVERAPKWKNSIGQALWYGLQRNKQPGIILLVESPAQRKYAIQLGSALDYAGLGNSITVWLWPDDFPGVEPRAAAASEQQQPAAGTGQYWLNLNGNKRHKSSCRWFKNTAKGRLCTADEGVAAGCCR
ncbi:hypothetical protein FUA23_05225 [Neolewinella aurantiaca]|uniref:Uncharacterized protein n=1 Tax=Neolewinella aurantiaca TaxID=2602767 RepID=A0A5C7FWP6_9BACT|nr:hypothetical protein [Neolewinella aurantiaca]TXF90842.1 hypothetical protein FUA23_05225 [Neolewinella aurantiaca]